MLKIWITQVIQITLKRILERVSDSEFTVCSHMHPIYLPADLYWTAPELLRREECPYNGTQKGDVYGFAIITKELIHHGEKGPYHDFLMEPKGKIDHLSP